MKTRLFMVAAVMAVALCVSGCHRHEHDAVQLAADADTGTFVAATLATLGSFEWDAAPLTNHAATSLHEVAVALKRQRITKDDAQKQVDAIDHAHHLIQQALTACGQDSRTGKCTKDEAAARALLDQARVALSDIP